jgi:MraZ protein
MRFLGNIEARVDVKGRVFLPAAFRKVLQSEGEDLLVLRKDVHENCLVLYPQSVWVEQMDFMRSKLNRWNREQQNIFRQFVSDVENIALDGNGRILLSRRFMEVAGIDQMVRFIGVGDTIEIWAASSNSEQFMNPDDFSKALEELMGGPTPTLP